MSCPKTKINIYYFTPCLRVKNSGAIWLGDLGDLDCGQDVSGAAVI